MFFFLQQVGQMKLMVESLIYVCTFFMHKSETCCTSICAKYVLFKIDIVDL